jgi:hypothetical protein
VVFDDKLSVLDAVERMDERVFTVHVRQGHYGVAAAASDGYCPDRSLERIGELLDLDLNAFLGQPD